MSEVTTFAPGEIVWIDLATSDPAGAEQFYKGLFGWERDVNTDPQYGGYGFFKSGGKIAAGVGPLQSEGQPVVWSVYIGTEDAEATASKVEAAGGKVVAPAFAVGEIGKMAVLQDPSGAFISVWQSEQMPGVEVREDPGSLSWTELQAKGLEATKSFYKDVFGWGEKVSDMGNGMSYTEWQLNDHSVAGAMEGMAPMSFWLVYITVGNVDEAVAKAKELGGSVITEAQEFPGGRFAIITDPQGAPLGIAGS